MNRYSEEFINEARTLRAREKLSYRELGRRIGVSETTIENWFRETVGNRWDSLINANEKRRREYKNSEISVVRNFKFISKNQAKLLVGILYGCEGSKYPATKGVSFSNSDPYLVVAFLRLLKKSFDLDRGRLFVHLQIHSNHNFGELKKFWSRLLDIPEERFMKPTVTVPTGRKHRKNYQGTCTLRYRDYKIQLKLLGIFETFVKKFSRFN